MGRIVIVAYKPAEGQADALRLLVKTHVPRLIKENLVTGRVPVLLESTDGTIIEIFEWLSAEAVQQAHQNKTVQQMWGEFEEVCTYVPLSSLGETADLFTEFASLD